MRLAELVAPLPAPKGAEDLEIAGLTADSRQVKPGYLFAAITGLTQDGRAFALQAVQAGAAAVLAEKGSPPMPAPVVEAEDVRLALSRIAARFYPRQPETAVAVTGTNGKSSTVEFLRQIWSRAGLNAASIGTLGVRTPGGRVEMGHTTPDPIGVHRMLQGLAETGVTHVALEASSHGLTQHRMDSVRLRAGGFTNLTQDHFDYHQTFEDYYAAKRRLFDALLPAGAPAVIISDSEWGRRIAVAAADAGLDVRTVGFAGDWIRLVETRPAPDGQHLRVQTPGKEFRIDLPLIGEFQAMNALLAAGLAAACGMEIEAAIAAIPHLSGVRGRLELAGRTPSGGQVFVDYAHTPDGLYQMLRTVRRHASRHVWIVFGAGGDRDPGKRAKMGAAATRFADRVIVTDDNPRTEDPAAIRAEVMRGARGERETKEIPDRREAIFHAVSQLGEGDILVIAGKGHETGQIYGAERRPFDDLKVAREAIEAAA
jgi:UDP-N-acetylmuramoyl-L-alanyl-D-glutamate--2,6-diaminopimelate ligase